LNLADNDLILTNSDRALVQQQIGFARHGGLWDRPGITSSAAASSSPRNKTLGVLSGQQYRSVFGSGATFDGFAVGDSDVLVKFTYYGDSDLNGVVNFDDYARIDSGFNSGLGNEWFEGDFDLNGAVNFDDYALLDLGFNTQSGTLVRALAWLENRDRSDAGMNSPALERVVDHFHQFGNEYAASFITAVPEPGAMGAIILPALAGLLRHRRRT